MNLLMNTGLSLYGFKGFLTLGTKVPAMFRQGKNIGSVLKNGESKTINTMITEDLSKAASIEYEVIK